MAAKPSQRQASAPAKIAAWVETVPTARSDRMWGVCDSP